MELVNMSDDVIDIAVIPMRFEADYHFANGV